MGFLEREFIASPDEAKDQIVFKHGDLNIRRFTRCTVNADQVALFVRQGTVLGTVGPGRHVLDADELPFLGAFIDNVIGADVYKAELYFVATREFTDEPFGGRMDDIQDAQTGFVVSVRLYGTYSMRVIDPAALVTKLTGTVDVTDNQRITDWVDEILLKTMKTQITRDLVRTGWPILGLSAYLPEIEQSALVTANGDLAPYGVTIARLGTFDLSLSDEDMVNLKQLAKDKAYTQLAGGFQQMAQAELLRGAGAGMAKGGGATGGAFLAAGLGVGGQVGALGTAAPAGAAVAPLAVLGTSGGAAGGTNVEGQVTCVSCGAANRAGSRFCSECGVALTPAGEAVAAAAISTACVSCGALLAAGAKFCPGCGTAVAEVTP